MAKARGEEEKKETLLRTTADVMLHSLRQLECCASDWPEFRDDAKILGDLVEKLEAEASKVGYIRKGK